MRGFGGNFEYVSDQARFEKLCFHWSELPAIGLDTEFIRTRTYYSKVGLLQFGDNSGCYLVDPLTVTDWEPLRRLLAATRIIIHASGEDLGLLYNLLGCVPGDLFDTQLAAAFLGEGFSLSYRDIVNRFCGVELPKSETRSNWLQRPLRPAQLEYAADDVRFLPALQEILEQRLSAGNAREWFDEDCRRLLSVAELTEDPESWKNSYKQINDFNSLNDRGLILLRQLCYWREQQMRVRDMPRNWIAGDKELVALARHSAKSDVVDSAVIQSAAGIDRRFAKRYAVELSKFLQQTPETMAVPERGLSGSPLDHVEREKLKKCRELARSEAERIGISPELLGKRKQLQQLVHVHARTGRIVWPAEFHGWRQRVLAPGLAEILPETKAVASN